MPRILATFWAIALAAQGAYVTHTVAGSDWIGDGGPARQALLLQAEGLAADREGNVYIADAQDHRVRMVDTSGVIHTVAGPEAGLRSPYGLAMDPAGNLYIADLGNGRVVRMSRNGAIASIEGFAAPRNLAIDRAGNLYVSDFEAHTVYRIALDGTKTVVLGPGVLSYPTGVAVDAAGAVYIADSGHDLIRKVASGAVSTVAQVTTPTGLAFDSFGTLFVADAFSEQVLRIAANGTTTPTGIPARDLAFGADGSLYAASGALVRRAQPSGVTSIFAGGGNPAHGDHGPAVDARLNGPSGIAADTVGNIYIADRDNHRVRRVDPSGIITTVAGTGLPGDGGDGGLATRATFEEPVDVAVDPMGNLYIADRAAGRVRMVSPGGIVFPVASGFTPSSIAVDTAGRLFAANDENGRIYRIDAGGALVTLALNLDHPTGLFAGPQGSLYFTEPEANRVRKLTPTGAVLTVPSDVTQPRGVVLTAKGEVFAAPADLAIDPYGVIYTADPSANRVYALTPAPEPILQVTALHAATLEPGPIAPGMLLIVRGAPAGSEILIGGLPAPVLAEREGEVTVRVPVEIEGLDAVPLETRIGDTSRAAITLTVAAAAPGLFLAANEDGSVNSPSNAATRGSIVVLYGTGEGVSDVPPEVTISGYPVEILYAGAVAGYPGLWQINVRVPAGYLPPGEHSMVVAVAEASSPPLPLALK